MTRSLPSTVPHFFGSDVVLVKIQFVVKSHEAPQTRCMNNESKERRENLQLLNKKLYPVIRFLGDEVVVPLWI